MRGKEFFILGLVLLVTACTTTKPVVVPAGTKTDISISQNFDSISRDHIRYVWLSPGEQHDTLHVLDSIYIDRWRTRTDSIVHIDTAVVVREVAQPLSSGGKFLRNSGMALWVIIVLFVLATVVGIVLKFAK